ncbi:hypothetical protein AKO1_015190 [Acrasis kona]|uniref:Cytidyltransferase-like domain-containing protein n=1 Tax=Acrasis kona TaxID=1008807 RepID=A0AAW2ZGI3_9EUKA
MNQTITNIIQHIHQNGKRKLVLFCTGAGSTCSSWLLSVSGASRTILESTVPYSYKATEHILGSLPKNFVSTETAIGLAKKAYDRAIYLNFQTALNPSNESIVGTFVERAQEVIGVGCTAAIVTDRDRKGKNHAYVGVYSNSGCSTFELVMNKGFRSRQEEENMVSSLILKAIAQSVVEVGSPILTEYEEHFKSLLVEEESVVTHIHEEPGANIQTFFSQPTKTSALYYNLNGKVVELGDEVNVLFERSRSQDANDDFVRLVYSGSFNPAHDAHFLLMKTAAKIIEERYNKKVACLYDLGIKNADKGDLDIDVVKSQRLSSFPNLDEVSVLLTRVPLFLNKAKLFPSAWFVVGIDTVVRLVDKKYYNNSESDLIDALATFLSLRTKFVVGGRVVDQKFQTLSDVKHMIPRGFENLFIEVTEDEFRLDLSSTEIRNKRSI